MSIAYVCPYACVPWLGTLSAGLLRAFQRPVTGGATSTGGPGSPRGAAVLAWSDIVATMRARTTRAGRSVVAHQGPGRSVTNSPIASAIRTSQDSLMAIGTTLRTDMNVSPCVCVVCVVGIVCVRSAVAGERSTPPYGRAAVSTTSSGTTRAGGTS